MKKLTLLLTAGILTGLLAGCSSTKDFEAKQLVLTHNAKVYAQTKSIYCGGVDVKSYFESKDMIVVSCMDGSSKTVFLED